MAVSIVTDSTIVSPFNSNNYCFTKFNYATSGDTVKVPTGCLAAAVLGVGTAPTTSIAAGSQDDSVTITGGTTGSGVILVTLHGGSVAGSGAR